MTLLVIVTVKQVIRNKFTLEKLGLHYINLTF